MAATTPTGFAAIKVTALGNPLVLEENMTFFTHMILNDRAAGRSMAVAEQAIITSGAPEVITHVPRTPIIRN